MLRARRPRDALLAFASGSYANGIGLQYNLNAGELYTNGIAINMKMDDQPLVLALSYYLGDQKTLGLTADYWLFNNRITVTGNKLETIRYYRHSRYPGGLKSRTLREQLAKSPDRIIFEAVKGMMPKTKLGRAQLKKLRIYAGNEHPHEAQQPKPLSFEGEE